MGQVLADQAKVVFRMNLGAAVMGLGYIVGLKYSAIIAAGSFVSWYLLIPVVIYWSRFNLTPGVNCNIAYKGYDCLKIYSELM